MPGSMETLSAQSLVQVSVAESPTMISAGSTEKTAVGAAQETLSEALVVVLPPGPVAVSA